MKKQMSGLQTNEWPSKNTIFKNENIGIWFDDQLNCHNKHKLSSNRIKSLKTIGVPFKSYYDINWNNKYNFVKEYFNVYHKFPTNETIYKNIKIGSWLNTQRSEYRKNRLSIKRINKLKEIGYPIEKNSNDELNKKWNEVFDLLKEFHKVTNRWPKDKEIYYGHNIGNWLYEQKHQYKKGNLSKIRQIKLEGIGICLKTRNNNERWNDAFEILIQYHEETGELPKSKCIYHAKKIGSWLYEQKKSYKKGKLKNDRQKKLESIGVVFSEDKK